MTTDAGTMVGGIQQVGIWWTIAVVFGIALILVFIISKFNKEENQNAT